MTCEQFDLLLDAYLDRTLDAERRHAMDDHLEGCVSCRAAAAEMQLVLSEAAALPRSITPPRSLWPDISSRLTPRGRLRPARPMGWSRWAPLAAAAVLLVTLTAVVTFRLSRPSAPVGAPVTSARPQVVGFAADREYVLAAEDLERVLAEGRDNSRRPPWPCSSATLH